MKPSDFIIFPWNSVTKNAECEIIIVNIMKILKRTGDTFRELLYDEYKSERLKDKNYSDSEKTYFDKVINYCKSEDTAKLFSSIWAEIKTNILFEVVFNFNNEETVVKQKFNTEKDAKTWADDQEYEYQDIVINENGDDVYATIHKYYNPEDNDNTYTSYEIRPCSI